MPWPPIPLDTPLGELSGKHVAAAGIGVLGKRTLVLISVGRLTKGRVWVSCMDVGLRSDPPAIPHTELVPASATLASALLGFGPIRATSAGEVPHIVWPGNSRPPQNRWLLLLPYALALAIITLAFWLQSPALVFSGLGTILAVYLGSRFTSMAGASMPPHVREDGRELMASAVLSRLTTALPEGPSPAQRVDQVKATYGELAADIVYRIEASALFDPAVEQTQRFQLALLAWDPSSPEAASLATEVEDSFTEARATAERLGLDHLPETARGTASRAVKSAKLALSATTEAERLAARRQVADLLGSLALYWLPPVDEDAPSLIGQRRMIEPAP